MGSIATPNVGEARRRFAGLLVATSLPLLAAAMPGEASARHGLLTGFSDPEAFQALDQNQRLAAFRNMASARGSVVRVTVKWSWVAPSEPPTSAAARDPSWPGYSWDVVDQPVREATAAGLRVLLSWTGAPDWAEGPGRPASREEALAGSWRPSPAQYRLFAEAAARRYSGRYRPAGGARLPRVRYWQAWNEPNQNVWLAPQWRLSQGRFIPESPVLYRRLLNAFYLGVKAIHRSNYVVSAGTSPFGEPWRGASRMPPALFTREFLCVRGLKRPRPKRCSSSPARFDALAHHPYPIGPPRQTAINRDDVVVPDLWKLTRPLRAAIRGGKVAPRGRKAIWATEISWDTNPPDPDGFPAHTQARYIQEALYTLWRQGASVVTWWLLRDQAAGSRGFGGTTQSGIFFRGQTVQEDTRKPGFRAFRFPFTAYRKRGVAQIWGLAPKRGRVTIETRRGGRWRTYERLRTRPGRMFFAARRVRRGSVLRARQGSDTSLSWRVGPNITE
jgi:hypothetical protein